MKTFVTLLTILLAMVFVVPAFAGEEPYKAVVENDKKIPLFYVSPKVYQFTHWDTDYYDHCKDVICPPFTPGQITGECKEFGACFECPSRCRERFSYQASAVEQPEVCCTEETVHTGRCVKTGAPCENNEQCLTAGELILPEHERDKCRSACPGYQDDLMQVGDSEEGDNVAILAPNVGYYEWVIALPKKPEGELNLEIECGVLKPNSWSTNYPVIGHETINLCAAVTGEPIGSGTCTRKAGQPLIKEALPRIEVIAHPGCLHAGTFEPFHLTAYKNPSNYAITTQLNDPDCKDASGAFVKCLNNSQSLQVLNGSSNASIALKACMEKTVLIKWPVSGTMNELGETEASLEAGDLIKVKMKFVKNTVDVYCNQYSLTIGGIGVAGTLLDEDNCDCVSDFGALCEL